MTYAFRDDTVSKYRELHNAPETPIGKSASRLKIVYMCGLFYFFYLAIEGESPTSGQKLICCLSVHVMDTCDTAILIS